MISIMLLGKVYIAREKQSNCVVALKAITKKDIVRLGVSDLIQNEVEIQIRLRYL